MKRCAKMDESFEMRMGERRSFFCPNKLWAEMRLKINDCISVSTYIRQDILEKLIKEEPLKKDYFEDLMSKEVYF